MFRTLVLLAALPLVAVAEEKRKETPRTVLEAWLDAALSGKVEAAQALAVEGADPAKKKTIEEFQAMLRANALKVPTVLVGEKLGKALAVSEPVKVTMANPDGRDTGVMTFQVVKVKDKWRVKDIDFKTPEKAKADLADFKTKHADAVEVK